MGDNYSYVNLNGEQIYVRCIGEGEPIVFLHGGPGGEHRFFLPHVLPLAEKNTLVFYDQRGCGQSQPAENKQYSMMDEVNTLESLRKELGYAKLNLFGESWGSMLALLYAVTHPNRVNKILLTAAIGVTKEGFTRFGEELGRRLSEEDQMQLSMLEKSLESGQGSVEDIFKVLNPYYVYSTEALDRKTKTVSNSIVNEIMSKDILENYDLTSKVDTISHIPILVAQGSHDLLTPEAVRELLINHIPRAELIEIENCGHWTVVEKPDEIIKITKEFFS